MQPLELFIAQIDWSSNWWWALFALPYLLALVSIPSVLLQRRGAPLSALSWSLTLFSLPYLGLFLWWAMGRNHLKRRRRLRRLASLHVSDRMTALREDLPHCPEVDWDLLPIKRLPEDMAQWVFPSTTGNRVKLLVDAAEAYPAIERAVREATDHVHVMFYIWKNDATGRWFRDLLVQKAAQGVLVRVMVDAVGSSRLSRRFMDPLRRAGAQVEAFLRPNLLSRAPHFNFRNHRKIVLVDGRVAFVGGMNIGDEYTHDWHDTAIELRGPVVDHLQEVFADDWFFVSEQNLTQSRYFGRWAEDATETPSCEAVCHVVASGPHMQQNTTRDAFFAAATQAKRRIYITTPYFIPDQSLQTALRTAAYRGVDVRVLLPGKSDWRLVQWAGRSYYPELLASGVRIFEYQDGMVHAKNIVLDDDVSMVGSANLDIRSFRLNFELSCFVKDAALNRELSALFERNLQRSQEVELEALRRRHVIVRLTDAVANLLSPLM
ncbi:MAG: cardiolipin synthase [Planctomycetes bacterium]|nr:cardiolipin synthase [Planctomycetota bacterium]